MTIRSLQKTLYNHIQSVEIGQVVENIDISSTNDRLRRLSKEERAELLFALKVCKNPSLASSRTIEHQAKILTVFKAPSFDIPLMHVYPSSWNQLDKKLRKEIQAFKFRANAPEKSREFLYNEISALLLQTHFEAKHLHNLRFKIQNFLKLNEQHQLILEVIYFLKKHPLEALGIIQQLDEEHQLIVKREYPEVALKKCEEEMANYCFSQLLDTAKKLSLVISPAIQLKPDNGFKDLLQEIERRLRTLQAISEKYQAKFKELDMRSNDEKVYEV